eukprot:TRINITY_DN360_c0_g1_i3.p1 TRINITY_DN360_c0_g1~~TRINITY_DN360_c0_g1_i3.p1  ORF type:complete len:258 (-),score=34.21 TRINITY_DN360_c0_g1_i3:29-802(-)
MQSSFEYWAENDSCYDVVPIKVLLVRSRIYFDEAWTQIAQLPVKSHTHEEMIEFILNLPVFKNLGTPLDVIINELSRASKLSVENHQILYRTADTLLYIFAGVFPFEGDTVYVRGDDLALPIFIKYRETGKCMRDYQDFQVEKSEKAKSRRGNERVIGDVIDALLQWKNLYTVGQTTGKGEFIRRTREDAARLLNIPKKTLDDYSAQVKLANDFGFDFQLNSREKFGVLRKFNRAVLSKKNFYSLSCEADRIFNKFL